METSTLFAAARHRHTRRRPGDRRLPTEGDAGTLTPPGHGNPTAMRAMLLKQATDAMRKVHRECTDFAVTERRQTCG
ncbi:hypothetical protein ABLN97_00940 [Mycobacterium tuberculosis]